MAKDRFGTGERPTMPILDDESDEEFDDAFPEDVDDGLEEELADDF